MNNSPTFMVDLESVLERYKIAEQRDYQIACIKDAIEGLNQGADVVIDLPTGTGKTLIYAPIVAEVSDRGDNALVLAATKQAQRRVSSEIAKFQKGSRPALIFGIQEYSCPILGEKAQNWCCGEQKEEHCKLVGINCDVIRSDKDYASSNLVVTNFSKFLLAPVNRKYDLMVLDDSHSFENTKEQAFQITIHFGAIRDFYGTGIQNTQLMTLIEGFLNIFGEVFERCVEPDKKEGVIGQEYVLRLAHLYNEREENELKQAIRVLPEPRRSICWQIYYFIKRCKSSSKYQFYIRKDFYNSDDSDSSELISRSNEILEFVIRRRFSDSRVILATATPGNVKLHANSCTLKGYDNSGPGLITVPSVGSTYHELDNWFAKLGIIIVEDIGDTREYSSFEKAIELTSNILKSREERALVLFKNYRDQKSAYRSLSRVFQPDKLFFIDVSLQDTDLIENLASKSQISLASASSTLWEGVNIEKLRLAIIVSPPFIRPQVGQKEDYPYFERRMLVRLQQGIGRLIRHPGDFGVAVLTDQRFKKYVKRSMFNQKLREKVQSLNSDAVVSTIRELFTRWGKS